MTNFGITPAGYRAKRLDDIKTEIEASLREAFGDTINLLPSGVLGQISGTMAERFSKLWEHSEGNYNSQYPLTADGTTLDNVVSITGITRQPGIKSSANLQLFGTIGTIIPATSVFSVLNDPTSRFVLGTSVTLVVGNSSIWDLTFDNVPDVGSFKLQYKGVKTIAIPFGAVALDIENALNGLSSPSSVVVAGDFLQGFTITGENGELFTDIIVTDDTLALGAMASNAAIVNTTPGVPNATAIVEEEVLTGGSPIGFSAPSGSLTVIENPITGLDSVVNQEDATIGRSIESDADLKQRREESLQRAGAGTLGAIISILADLYGVTAVVGFENITFLIDIDGRPPKSFEIVIDGGDLQEIAQSIWANKPAGIETFGSIMEGILDSQGFAQNVKLSRPTDVGIYVEIDLTVDANFPANGLILAEAAILAYGNGLGIGKDIIVVPQLVCSLNNISGITNIDVRIGKVASPTLGNNIVIAPDEISRWDTSRTTVISL